MPNLTTAFPKKTGNIEEDYNNLYKWAVSLTDELKSILCNLDSGNVTEALSVKAQNIDVSQAKIKDAQVKSLTADKLTAGTIDTGEITVSNDTEKTDGQTKTSIEISDQSIKFAETKNDGENDTPKTVKRIWIGEIGSESDSEYIFLIQNRDGSQKIYMDENGNVSITGTFYSANGVVSGQAIELGHIGNPELRFIKTSGSVGAKVSYDDSNDMLTISANNINFDCDSCTFNGDPILTEKG